MSSNANNNNALPPDNGPSKSNGHHNHNHGHHHNNNMNMNMNNMQHLHHNHNNMHHHSNGNAPSQQSTQKGLIQKPSTTISRPPRSIDHNANMKNMGIPSRSGTAHHPQSVVSAQDSFVYQMGMARNAHSQHVQQGQGHIKPDDYDPDSNVYVANLPSDYGKDRLYKLFSTYGQIVRYKFVTPDEPTQPGYGFVQFQNRKDAHRAIKNLEGHIFSTGETIYLSIALRRRSSLSDEPTNLYVKNLPGSWNNDKLRKVFGAYGSIRQSKVVGDGIAFVRFEDHEQALNAINRLDKQMVDNGCKLEVRFATRKTAANAYRLQQIPQSKTNENNLYIRNLPKYYNQSSLETLFANYGKISSAKINDNGIAFVRFAHAEDAKRAIQELNGKKPPQFEEEIVVKLAHFDIGDSRNRWANKFGSGGGQMSGASTGGHFNNNMYQNHFNAPIGSMNGGYAANPFTNGNVSNVNVSPLPSMPSSNASTENTMNTISPNTVSPAQDVNVNVNMNNLNVTGNNNQNMMQIQMNNQMQAIQQQMQQWSIANPVQSATATTTSNANQFAFPAANPVMMQAPTLFAQSQTKQTALPRQLSNDSHHSHHSVSSGAASPQSNHSNNSNDANTNTPNNKQTQKTWSKKQQQLGDQLYQKVFAKTGASYAPKITGMLIKMGDKKAQECIDNPSLLDEQIKIAKNLLETTEGLQMNQLNGPSVTSPNGLSPTSLLQQNSGSPTANTPLMNRLNNTFTVNSPNAPNRFQALNTTKPITPNNNNLPSPHTPNQQQQQINTAQLNAAQLSSIPNLLTSSIPNSLYGTMPTIFGTPQLFAMSPASASNATSRTPQSVQTLNPAPNGSTTPNKLQQPQYLFTTIPNLVTSPAQQQTMFNMNGVNVVTTPNSLEQQQQQQQQQANIQQSGWGLAVNPQINVIQTQPATQFIHPQPALYPRSQ